MWSDSFRNGKERKEAGHLGTPEPKDSGPSGIRACLGSRGLGPWRLAQTFPSHLSSYLFKSRLVWAALPRPRPAAGCQVSAACGATVTLGFLGLKAQREGAALLTSPHTQLRSWELVPRPAAPYHHSRACPGNPTAASELG